MKNDALTVDQHSGVLLHAALFCKKSAYPKLMGSPSEGWTLLRPLHLCLHKAQTQCQDARGPRSDPVNENTIQVVY